MKKSSAKAKKASIPKKNLEHNEREVMKHCAKTVYFNDMWVESFGRTGFMLSVWSCYQVYLGYHAQPMNANAIVFDALSLLIAGASVMFILRMFRPLFFFKASFLFTLIQVSWFVYVRGQVYWSQLIPSDNGDESTVILQNMELNIEQIPMGSIFFVMSWCADRFMKRTRIAAEETVQGVQKVLKRD